MFGHGGTRRPRGIAHVAVTLVAGDVRAFWHRLLVFGRLEVVGVSLRPRLALRTDLRWHHGGDLRADISAGSVCLRAPSSSRRNRHREDAHNRGVS